MSRDVPRRRDETILTQPQPLCAADEVLAAASCTLRRVHRSVRVFFALLQTLCAEGVPTGTGVGTAAVGLPTLIDLATEFVGPLSSSDMDVLAAVDDTQRADIVRLRNKHDDLSAVEELALASLQESLIAALADPVTTPAAKARAVTDATRKRRELAVKRTQRLQSMQELERPFRVALFKWLPTMSLEYGDESLHTTAGPTALRTMSSADMLPPGGAHDEADAAVERSVHAMLAKSLAALHRRFATAAPSSGKPPPAATTPAGTVTVASDVSRSLTRVLQNWPSDRNPAPRTTSKLPAVNPASTEGKSVGESDASEMMARWAAVDRLLWPREGDADKPEESAELMIRRVKQQVAQLTAAEKELDLALRQAPATAAPRSAAISAGQHKTPSSATPATPSSLEAHANDRNRTPAMSPALSALAGAKPSNIVTQHSTPDGLGGSSNPSSPLSGGARGLMDSHLSEDDGAAAAEQAPKRFAAVYSDAIAEKLRKEREEREEREAYDRDMQAMAERMSPRQPEPAAAEDPDVESITAGKRLHTPGSLGAGSSPSSKAVSSPQGPGASSPRTEGGGATFLTSTTDGDMSASKNTTFRPAYDAAQDLSMHHTRPVQPTAPSAVALTSDAEVSPAEASTTVGPTSLMMQLAAQADQHKPTPLRSGMLLADARRLEKELMEASWASERALQMIRSRTPGGALSNSGASGHFDDPSSTRHFGSLVTGGAVRPWTPPSLPFTLNGDAAFSSEGVGVVNHVQLAPLKATKAAHARAERQRNATNVRTAIQKMRDEESTTAQVHDLPRARQKQHQTAAQEHPLSWVASEQPINENDLPPSRVAATSGALVSTTTTQRAASPHSVEYARVATRGGAEEVGTVFGYFPLPKTVWGAGGGSLQPKPVPNATAVATATTLPLPRPVALERGLGSKPAASPGPTAGQLLLQAEPNAVARRLMSRGNS